jgi:AbiV family abortive infection protein
VPSPELARSLVAALLQNASDLTADARLLLENRRFARAYALAVLSVEELGKTYLCLQVALGDGPVTAREFWTGWRNHV